VSGCGLVDQCSIHGRDFSFLCFSLWHSLWGPPTFLCIEADHTELCNAVVKNAWMFTSMLPVCTHVMELRLRSFPLLLFHICFVSSLWLHGCFHCCCRDRSSRMKFKGRRRQWKRRSDAGGVSAGMLKMIKLIVIVLPTLREVRVAALSVSTQTPGRGGIFCHKCFLDCHFSMVPSMHDWSSTELWNTWCSQ